MPERGQGGDGRAVLEGARTRYGRGARAFDLTLTVLFLPLAMVLGLLVAIAVALDSPGPVLFRSRRVGRDGRPFRMVKFRTMRHQELGPVISCQDDRRYTPIGRLLAASRLDELPQLWNVLRGQMRLVGPRPEIEEFVLDQADCYRRILSVPPGITGPTQLEFADEGRLLATASDPEQCYRRDLLPAKVQLDLGYVTAGSRTRDLALLVRTWAVPLRQLARSAADSSRRPRGRAALVLARGLVLAAAVVAMVAVFAAQGAAARTPEGTLAQAATAPPSDPAPASPSGVVYELPLDSARSDGAPRPRRRGRSTARTPEGGGSGGDSTASRDRGSPIRSENNFGSSSEVPGVERPGGGSSSASGVRGGSGANGDDKSYARSRSAEERRVPATQTAGAWLPARESGDGGPSSSLIVLLLGSLLLVGVAAGTVAGRARRN